jgi:hypothetical protein
MVAMKKILLRKKKKKNPVFWLDQGLFAAVLFWAFR